MMTIHTTRAPLLAAALLATVTLTACGNNDNNVAANNTTPSDMGADMSQPDDMGADMGADMSQPDDMGADMGADMPGDMGADMAPPPYVFPFCYQLQTDNRDRQTYLEYDLEGRQHVRATRSMIDGAWENIALTERDAGGLVLSTVNLTLAPGYERKEARTVFDAATKTATTTKTVRSSPRGMDTLEGKDVKVFRDAAFAELLTAHSYDATDTLLSSQKQTWDDGRGLRLTVEDDTNGDGTPERKTSFTYDASGCLTSTFVENLANAAQNNRYTFEVDAECKRLKTTRVQGMNMLPSWVSVVTYDAQGRLATRLDTLDYEADGKTNATEAFSYDWSVFEAPRAYRQVTRTEFEADGTTVSKTTTSTFDAATRTEVATTATPDGTVSLRATVRFNAHGMTEYFCNDAGDDGVCDLEQTMVFHTECHPEREGTATHIGPRALPAPPQPGM